MKNIQSLLMNAVIAAVYAVLTIGLSPISYGPIQVRLSECMVLLAFYNRKWIPGLTIGCLLANLNSPFGVTDMVVGTTATLVSLLLMRFAASLAPVLINGIFIGLELAWLSQIGPGDSLAGVMAYIGLGEFVSVSVVGVVLFHVLLKNPVLKKYIMD